MTTVAKGFQAERLRVTMAYDDVSNFSSVDLLDELRSKRFLKAYKTEYLKIMSFSPNFL